MTESATISSEGDVTGAAAIVDAFFDKLKTETQVTALLENGRLVPNSVLQVADWHEAFGVPALLTPEVPDPLRCALRTRLLTEELGELTAAIEEGDLAKIAKELCDLKAHLFNAVHASNMSKLGDDGRPVLRDDGKVLKGPNYQPPDIDAVLALAAGDEDAA